MPQIGWHKPGPADGFAWSDGPKSDHSVTGFSNPQRDVARLDEIKRMGWFPFMTEDLARRCLERLDTRSQQHQIMIT